MTNPFPRTAMLCAALLWAGVHASAALIPFEFHEGLIWIKVKAEGAEKPLNFLLDSGAGSSVLDFAAAKRLGVTMGAGERVQMVGQSVASRRVVDFSATVAGIPIQPDPLALDLSETSGLCGRRIDGLVGHDFFHGRIVQIDYKARLIRVLEEADERCCSVVPLKVRDNALCIPVSVNGSRTRWTRLDTGCDASLHWVDGSGGGDVDALVMLEGESLGQVPTTLHRRAFFPSEAGLLGNGVLSNYRVTIDTVNRRLLLRRS